MSGSSGFLWRVCRACGVSYSVVLRDARELMESGVLEEVIE